jgi:methyltransferase (TIGR00027 family)
LREDEKDVLQFANEHPLASIGRLFTTARSRIAEDALSGAVERGILQIVILGAGLDTFALRSPHGARQIRIYEVDHPATQAWKRQRLAEAQLAVPPWLILVPVDFERDDLGETLVGAGFQENSPAFFTWLGVVPHLTQDAIDSTLDYMASIQNLEVVFDYMAPPPQTARIPTESDVGPISSVGSSHNRPTSAEDNEEASLLAMPGHRSCGRQ